MKKNIDYTLLSISDLLLDIKHGQSPLEYCKLLLIHRSSLLTLDNKMSRRPYRFYLLVRFGCRYFGIKVGKEKKGPGGVGWGELKGLIAEVEKGKKGG